MKLSTTVKGLIFLAGTAVATSNWLTSSCSTPCGKSGYGNYVNGECSYGSCSMDAAKSSDRCASNCETCGKCVDRYMLGDKDLVKIDTSECLGGNHVSYMAPTSRTSYCYGNNPSEVNNTKLHHPAPSGVWFTVDEDTPDEMYVDKFDPYFKKNCGWNCNFDGRSWAWGQYTSKALRTGICRQRIELDGVCKRRTCNEANCQNGFKSGKNQASVCFGSKCPEVCCEPVPAAKTCAENKGSNNCDSDFTYDASMGDVLVSDLADYNSLCCKAIPTCAQHRANVLFSCGVNRAFNTDAENVLCEFPEDYSRLCCKDAPTIPTCAEATDPEVYTCEEGYVYNNKFAGVSVEFEDDYSKLCCAESPCTDKNDKYILEVYRQCGSAIA